MKNLQQQNIGTTWQHDIYCCNYNINNGPKRQQTLITYQLVYPGNVFIISARSSA